MEIGFEGKSEEMKSWEEICSNEKVTGQVCGEFSGGGYTKLLEHFLYTTSLRISFIICARSAVSEGSGVLKLDCVLRFV